MSGDVITVGTANVVTQKKKRVSADWLTKSRWVNRESTEFRVEGFRELENSFLFGRRALGQVVQIGCGGFCQSKPGLCRLVCGVVRCWLLRLYYESDGDDERPGGELCVVALSVSLLCSGSRHSAQPEAGGTGSG